MDQDFSCALSHSHQYPTEMLSYSLLPRLWAVSRIINTYFSPKAQPSQQQQEQQQQPTKQTKYLKAVLSLCALLH